MRNAVGPVFNERSWGIQVIGEINRLLDSRHVRLSIRRAGGEYGASSPGKTTLFPDVVLFGDAAEKLMLQGWELKTPETSVDNEALLANAREKALRMRVGSFLVWNGQVAVLHELSGQGESREIRRWSNPRITSRAVLAAREIDRVERQADVDALCNALSREHDYALLLRTQKNYPPLPDSVWNDLLAFNRLLSGASLPAIGQEELHRVVQGVFQGEWTKTIGLFCTPSPLADLLVCLSIGNVPDSVVLDPCCGTGTIARAVMDFKRSFGVSEADVYRNVWASDRFPTPLTLSTLSLSSGRNVDSVIHLFQADALNLSVGEPVRFCNPKTGDEVVEQIPRFSHILLNPPFIRFESWGKNYAGNAPEASKALKIAKTHKADFLVPVVLKIADLLADGGVLGLVLPNSWLGTGWGGLFRRELLNRFHIRTIVGSGNGRWFQNAGIVANLVVLQKKDQGVGSGRGGIPETQFVVTKDALPTWSKDFIRRFADEIVLAGANAETSHYAVRLVTEADLRDMESRGMTWTAGFSDLSWFRAIRPHLVSAGVHFNIARGERRGWDALFFPGNPSEIDAEYLAPVLRSSTRVETLLAEPDGQAFCCSDSLETLRKKKARKTLKWIHHFERVVNGVGRPLPEVLGRAGMHWYEMSSSAKADIAVSMNPGERLFFMRMSSPTFVNQRLIRFTAKTPDTDIPLCHALLCSAAGCFFLEALGFGRGLGALDLNATKLRENLLMLNPGNVSRNARRRILEAFAPLLHRPVKPFLEEMRSDDRRRFEQAVLSAFSCEQQLDAVLGAARCLHEMRMTATSK